jgi:hypothetical protein
MSPWQLHSSCQEAREDMAAAVEYLLLLRNVPCTVGCALSRHAATRESVPSSGDAVINPHMHITLKSQQLCSLHSNSLMRWNMVL